MHPQKSVFTMLIPILCLTGIVVLAVMWNKEPMLKVKDKFQIAGPKTPPPTVE